MTITIERIINLLDEKNISAAKMMKDLEFSSGLFSQWKSEMQSPSVDKLDKIAEYLECSIDYLRGKTDIRKNSPSGLDSELIKVYNELSAEGKANLIEHAHLLQKAKK